MKTKLPTLAVLIMALGACSSGNTPDDAAAAPAGSAANAEAASAGAASGSTVAAEAGPVYLDVRTPEEFAAGHVEGTLHIPLADLDQRRAELEPYRDRDIVVYCRSGRRAGSAIELLQAHGFSRLTNGGGLTDMSARGLPIAR